MRSYSTLLAFGLPVLAVLALAGCGSHKDVAPSRIDTVVAEAQQRAFVDALRPRRPGRPLVAVVALNDGTEITDFLLTHAVLQRSGLVDVFPVAPRAGRVSLYPALEIDGAIEFAAFDAAHPGGADYVIVPAMKDDHDPRVLAWIKAQSVRGARVVAVCAGALVVANAGLLDGRHFTTHWYYREELQKKHPAAVYVPNQRYLVDRGVATTTGITASVPTMLALVEAIGGSGRARALADELGVSSWNPGHDSSRFGLDGRRRWRYVKTTLAFWTHHDWNVDVADGTDDIALAFAVDAWSRTGRIDVTAAAAVPVKLRSGIVLRTKRADKDDPRVPLDEKLPAVQQLDRTLCDIRSRLGAEDRERVMMELEYPDDGFSCPGAPAR
jgi:putative intracellular protease/amidase